MSTKTMTKPDNEASPAMYADRNKKWMPIIIEAVKEIPTLCVWSRSPHRPEWCRPDAPRRRI